MSETLYRKYRPQTFAEVIGQPHVKLTLQGELVANKLTHSYLFCGTRGVGKTTLARILAKAVNCEKRSKGESEPCNKCDSCVAITSGRSLDVIEIDAASNRRIDDVRELREHIPTGTTRSPFKVVIIDEVHMLTTEAFNALLKTLEEPPAHVIFILATTEVHKLPDTIISRCQRFDFKPLKLPELKERLEHLAKLENIKIDEDVIAEVAYLAAGSTRDAESYLGKLISLGEKHITRETASLILPHSDIKLAAVFVAHLVARQAAEAVKLINDFVIEGGEIGYFYRQVLEIFRKLLLIKLGGNLADYSTLELIGEGVPDLKALASDLTQSRLQQMLECWLDLEANLRQSDIPQLPLEVAVVELAGVGESATTNTKNEALGTKASVSVSKKEPTVEGNKSVDLSLEQIQKQWNQVVAKIKEINHSLSFILSIAEPTSLKNNTLTISFQYKLHQERVADHKVKQIIEQALQQTVGVPLIVTSIIKQEPTGVPDLFSSVLTSLGGQVVD